MSAVDAGGPFLAAAMICEKVLRENDGVVSAIRIIDRIITTASGQEAPEDMPPFAAQLKVLLIFKSGIANGTRHVKIKPVYPSGRIGQEYSLPILLEGEDRGVNLNINLVLQATEEGLYWIDISLEDELVTRMPLRIVYQRIGLGSRGTPVH